MGLSYYLLACLFFSLFLFRSYLIPSPFDTHIPFPLIHNPSYLCSSLLAGYSCRYCSQLEGYSDYMRCSCRAPKVVARVICHHRPALSVAVAFFLFIVFRFFHLLSIFTSVAHFSEVILSVNDFLWRSRSEKKKAAAQTEESIDENHRFFFPLEIRALVPYS